MSYQLLYNFYNFRHKSDLILFFMFCVYPFFVIPSSLPYFYGPRYVVLYIIAIIALIYLVSNGIQYIIKADIALVTFIIFLIISTLLSDDITIAWGGNSLRFTGASTYIFCGILLVLASRTDVKIRRILIELMVCAAAIVSVIAIMQNYGINIVPHEAYRASFHSYGTLGHPNFLGTYTVFIIPAAMMLFLYQKKNFWLFCTALLFGALLVSLTRGSWLALAGIFIIIIYHAYKNKELRKGLYTITFVFIATYIILSTTSSLGLSERASSIPVEITNVAEYTDTSVSIRIYVWQESIKILKNNWAFGIGADTINIWVPREYYEDKAYNTFLEIAVTMGIFALISFLTLLYFCLKQKGNYIQTILSFMIVAYLMQGQFNIDVIMNLPLLWIIMGLSLAGDTDYILKFTSINSAKVPTVKYNYRKTTLPYVLTTGFLLFLLLITVAFYMPRTTELEIVGLGKYEGQVRGVNILHGTGELTMESGAIYKGSFKHSMFDGIGKLIYQNGSYYKGEFKQGYCHGRGTLVNVDGITKEGIFEYGKMIEQIETD